MNYGFRLLPGSPAPAPGIVVTPSRVRLGAIELIELGSRVPRVERPYMAAPARRPFLANRSPTLGQDEFFADVGSFLSDAFELLFKVLADVINVPPDLASQGVGVLFDGLVEFLTNVPILGELAAQLLLVGKAVIQWGLSVPGLLLEGVSNIFGEVKEAIDATRMPSQKNTDISAAKNRVLEKAKEKGGDEFRQAVKDAIEGKPVKTESGETIEPKNPAPTGSEDLGVTAPLTGSDLGDKVLTMGIPIAGATAVALLLLG